MEPDILISGAKAHDSMNNEEEKYMNDHFVPVPFSRQNNNVLT